MDPLLIPFAKPLQVSLVETGLWQRIPDEPFFGGGSYRFGDILNQNDGQYVM
jgi:hypothetical protein